MQLLSWARQHPQHPQDETGWRRRSMQTNIRRLIALGFCPYTIFSVLLSPLLMPLLALFPLQPVPTAAPSAVPVSSSTSAHATASASTFCCPCSPAASVPAAVSFLPAGTVACTAELYTHHVAPHRSADRYKQSQFINISVCLTNVLAARRLSVLFAYSNGITDFSARRTRESPYAQTTDDEGRDKPAACTVANRTAARQRAPAMQCASGLVFNFVIILR